MPLSTKKQFSVTHCYNCNKLQQTCINCLLFKFSQFPSSIVILRFVKRQNTALSGWFNALKLLFNMWRAPEVKVAIVILFAERSLHNLQLSDTVIPMYRAETKNILLTGMWKVLERRSLCQLIKYYCWFQWYSNGCHWSRCTCTCYELIGNGNSCKTFDFLVNHWLINTNQYQSGMSLRFQVAGSISRRGIKQLHVGISFSSIFLLFSYESSLGPHS